MTKEEIKAQIALGTINLFDYKALKQTVSKINDVQTLQVLREELNKHKPVKGYNIFGYYCQLNLIDERESALTSLSPPFRPSGSN